MQHNVGEREGSSPHTSYEAIAEATSMPGSHVVTPPSTEELPMTPRGMPHSSVINESASYDVWRSSLTALLDMEAEEFEQMSNLISDKKMLTMIFTKKTKHFEKKTNNSKNS